MSVLSHLGFSRMRREDLTLVNHRHEFTPRHDASLLAAAEETFWLFDQSSSFHFVFIAELQGDTSIKGDGYHAFLALGVFETKQ